MKKRVSLRERFLKSPVARLLKNIGLLGCALYTLGSLVSTSTFLPKARHFADQKIHALIHVVPHGVLLAAGLVVVILGSGLIGHELRAEDGLKGWLAAPAVLVVIAAVMTIVSIYKITTELHGSPVGVGEAEVVEVAPQEHHNHFAATKQQQDHSSRGGDHVLAAATQPTEQEASTSSVPLKARQGQGCGCGCGCGQFTGSPSSAGSSPGVPEEREVREPESEEAETEELETEEAESASAASGAEAGAAAEARAEAAAAAAEARAEAAAAAAEARAEAASAAAQARAEAATWPE